MIVDVCEQQRFWVCRWMLAQMELISGQQAAFSKEQEHSN